MSLICSESIDCLSIFSRPLWIFQGYQNSKYRFVFLWTPFEQMVSLFPNFENFVKCSLLSNHRTLLSKWSLFENTFILNQNFFWTSLQYLFFVRFFEMYFQIVIVWKILLTFIAYHISDFFLVHSQVSFPIELSVECFFTFVACILKQWKDSEWLHCLQIVKLLTDFTESSGWESIEGFESSFTYKIWPIFSSQSAHKINLWFNDYYHFWIALCFDSNFWKRFWHFGCFFCFLTLNVLTPFMSNVYSFFYVQCVRASPMEWIIFISSLFSSLFHASGANGMRHAVHSFICMLKHFSSVIVSYSTYFSLCARLLTSSSLHICMRALRLEQNIFFLLYQRLNIFLLFSFFWIFNVLSNVCKRTTDQNIYLIFLLCKRYSITLFFFSRFYILYVFFIVCVFSRASLIAHDAWVLLLHAL